jgi:hypothetical protein
MTRKASAPVPANPQTYSLLPSLLLVLLLVVYVIVSVPVNSLDSGRVGVTVIVRQYTSV